MSNTGTNPAQLRGKPVGKIAFTQQRKLAARVTPPSDFPKTRG